MSNIAEYFKGKNILITGGTGSFGHHIVSSLLKFEPKKIVIFSRDEKKQYDMQNAFEAYNSGLLEFIIGDVRDYAKVYEALKNIDIVYHAAALKQVPNCEFHPLEAVKTNILGVENVRRATAEIGVEVVVAISTDKAVKPINVMGMTKAVQERIMLNPRNGKWDTKFLCVRYGNVLGSRGSVVPFFKQRIEENKPLPITSREMTRFMLTLDEAVNLVLMATTEGESGQLFVKKMSACHIVDLAHVMSKMLTDKDDYPMEEVGIRPGEKIHEVLVSEEEMRRAVETETHYIIYPYGKIDKPHLIRNMIEYTSNNTEMLNEEMLALLLKKERWI